MSAFSFSKFLMLHGILYPHAISALFCNLMCNVLMGFLSISIVLSEDSDMTDLFLEIEKRIGVLVLLATLM